MRIVVRAYLPNMLNWSDSERTQSSYNRNDKRFRMTNFLSCSVNGLLCKPSVGCLLLPKSLISSKMASRIHYDIANTHNSFNSELVRSHNFFYVHFFFLLQELCFKLTKCQLEIEGVKGKIKFFRDVLKLEK